jgi:hypothetical protein
MVSKKTSKIIVGGLTIIIMAQIVEMGFIIGKRYVRNTEINKCIEYQNKTIEEKVKGNYFEALRYSAMADKYCKD